MYYKDVDLSRYCIKFVWLFLNITYTVYIFLNILTIFKHITTVKFFILCGAVCGEVQWGMTLQLHAKLRKY